MTTLLILAALFALLLIRVPVAFALGGLGLALLVFGGFSPLMAPQAIVINRTGKMGGAFKGLVSIAGATIFSGSPPIPNRPATTSPSMIRAKLEIS